MNERTVIGQGNPHEARRQFYRDHAPRIFSYLLALCGARDEAEDLLQEVFLRALQKEEALGASDNAEAYLVRMARNLFIDARRRLSVQRKHEMPGGELEPLLAPARSPAPPGYDVETARTVQKALGELAQEQREVIVLHVYSGLTFRQIADAVQMNMNTVMSHYRRGMEKLEAKLNAAGYP